MNKFKLLFLGTLLTIFTSIIIVSCTKENENSTINEDQIAKSLVFKEINSQSTDAQNRTVYTGVNGDNIVIVSWTEWGRASRDCRGWGLCNADWFPGDRGVNYENGNGYATYLQIDDTTGKYYLEVKLAAESTIPENLLDLKIDADFELDTTLEIGQKLIFKQGTYHFDSTLGEFGGIKIILE
ncbi:MAG: hypothetical protein H7239_09390 [Flavobacterium sp.]|nr:hypothetical protein [Flavobacterium sp.]